MYTATKVFSATPFGLIAPIGAVAGLSGLLLAHQPLTNMSPGVLGWWIGLCAVSAVNIALWRQSTAALAHRKDSIDPELYRFQRLQLFLSTAYVFGCAFRSLLPRADVQRIGLVDSWMSSVLVGRSVATLAELCFAAQWALLLHLVSRTANSRFGITIAWLLVPLIMVAEICSWYGVLTTAYIGNAIEESIWALSGVLLLVGIAAAWWRTEANRRPTLAVLGALCATYVVYMCAVDVPMYGSRWLSDQASGREYLTLSQGLLDAGSRWTVTHAWEEWRPEMPWMSLYFSVGVWCSLALVHFPPLERRPSPGVPSNPAAVLN